MSYTITPVGVNLAAGLISTHANTNFLAGPPRIQATGIGTGAVVGDCARPVGSTSNDGDYIVLAIINANEVEVYPAPNVEAGVGNTELREQAHKLTILDEATVTATTIQTAVGDVRMAGFVDNVAASTAGRQWGIFHFLFREFVVNHSGATNTVLTIAREVWYNYWDRSSTVINSHWEGYKTPASPGTLEINCGGLVDGSDPRSVDDPWVFLGGFWQGNTKSQTRMQFGLVSTTSANQLFAPDDGHGTGRLSGCLIDAALATPITNGALDQLNHIVLNSPLYGYSPSGVLSNASTILCADSSTSGIIFGAPIEVRVGPGLELSDAAYTPATNVIISACQYPNPIEDYTEQQLATMTTGCVRKTYLYDPIYIEVNPLEGPKPLQDMYVTINRISDGHYIQVTNQTNGTYTVQINGVDHTHVSSGQTVTQLRNSLRNVILLGFLVDAGNANNGSQVAGTGIVLNSYTDDVPFTVEVTQEPTPGDLVVDPAPGGSGGGKALANGGDYRENLVGAYTTDALGRINTSGVDLDAFIGYENGVGVDFIHLNYEIRVEGEFFGPLIYNYKPKSVFEAQVAVPLSIVQGAIQ